MFESDEMYYELWDGLQDKFDYNSYVVLPISIFEFAQRTGTFGIANRLFPDVGTRKAFHLFLENYQVVLRPSAVQNQTVNNVSTPTGCCGGGTIR
jgi:hypothetical protein